MLIKLRIDEIVHQETLAYDLYNGQGELLCQAGETLTPRKLKRIAEDGLFRMQEKLPLQWLVQSEMPHFADQNALKNVLNLEGTLEAELTTPYLVNQQDAMPFLDSMFTFWTKLEKGEQIDIALLEVLENKLISTIVSKMDQLQYLNQLRIRDGFTYSHTLDVTALSIALGAKLGIKGNELKALALGALLHDLGKLYIPKPIMFKQTRLSDKEFEVIQLHPEIGYRIIKEKLRLPDEVARPALEHQELYAGGGYPQNLQYDEIHPFSQIVKIADVYDALTSRRPYKDCICSYKAIKIMLLEGGQSFNPEFLRNFLELANYPDEIPDDLK